MLKKIIEIEKLAKQIVELSTKDDDIISQEDLFRLQVDANDLYHQVKDLRKRIEPTL